MSDPIAVPQSWIVALAGGAWVGICGVVGYVVRKFDRVEKRVSICITRDELAAIEARIEARAVAAETRVVTMHSDNSNNFREVRLQLESVNSKLFELAAKK